MWYLHWNNTLNHFFFRFGIEFFTLRPLDKRDEDVSLSLVVKNRLPLIPESGNFQLSDYEKYELEREFFFDSSAGRVAGRSGGTVARLWRKNTSRFNERVNEINKGPSEDALGNGLKVFCGPDEAYYDDYLSKATDAFICGQYLARAGKINFYLFQIRLLNYGYSFKIR